MFLNTVMHTDGLVKLVVLSSFEEKKVTLERGQQRVKIIKQFFPLSFRLIVCREKDN